MTLSLPEEVEHQRFSKRPESSLLETGSLCTEQLRELARFCRAASLACLRSEACRQNKGHATQESQGGGADPSQNVKSTENALRCLNCHGSVPARPFGISGSGTHSVLSKRQWVQSQKTKLNYWSRSSSSL